MNAVAEIFWIFLIECILNMFIFPIFQVRQIPDFLHIELTNWIGYLSWSQQKPKGIREQVPKRTFHPQGLKCHNCKNFGLLVCRLLNSRLVCSTRLCSITTHSFTGWLDSDTIWTVNCFKNLFFDNRDLWTKILSI